MQINCIATLKGNAEKFKGVLEVLQDASQDGGLTGMVDFLEENNINLQDIPEDLEDADCHYLGLVGLLLLDSKDYKNIVRLADRSFLCGAWMEGNDLKIAFYGPGACDGFWLYLCEKSIWVVNTQSDLDPDYEDEYDDEYDNEYYDDEYDEYDDEYND